MSNIVLTPFFMYLGNDGNALQNGKIYIGNSGSIATASPKTVYWDSALTQPAAQPLRTSNGYIVRGGTISNVYYSGLDFSITVNESDDTNVYNTISAFTSGANVAVYGGTGGITTVDLTATGNITAVAITGSGTVTGATVASTGAITAATTITATGAITGASYSTAGAITATGAITSSGIITGTNIKATAAAASSASGVVSIGNATGTTVGAAGGASALPATPLGYLTAYIGTQAVKIPYYN